MSELIALAESSIKNKSARLCKSLPVPDSTGYSLRKSKLNKMKNVVVY